MFLVKEKISHQKTKNFHQKKKKKIKIKKNIFFAFFISSLNFLIQVKIEDLFVGKTFLLFGNVLR